jgi:hypothetical protein
MRYQLNDQDPHVKTVALEEHFSTPMLMQKLKSSTTEFRKFYLSSRSQHIGHNIFDQLAISDRLADLEEQRLSVDWPFEPNTTATHFLNQLPISELDREKIAHLNAERILRM